MQKPLQITFRDLERSPSLETLIRARAEKLGRFHPNIIGCRIVVETTHRAPETAKNPLGITVEVEIPGRPKVVARGSDERREAKQDLNAVVGRVFEAVERQLSDSAQIKAGTVKAHASAGEAGQVVRLFGDQDYGFVEVRGAPDLYFSRTAVVGGSFDALKVGTLVEVTRSAVEGPWGPQASTVRVLDGSRAPQPN